MGNDEVRVLTDCFHRCLIQWFWDKIVTVESIPGGMWRALECYSQKKTSRELCSPLEINSGLTYGPEENACLCLAIFLLIPPLMLRGLWWKNWVKAKIPTPCFPGAGEGELFLHWQCSDSSLQHLNEHSDDQSSWLFWHGPFRVSSVGRFLNAE